MFLSNCNWFRLMVIKFSGIVIEFSVMVIEFSGMVIEIRSKLVETITSKHYFTIIYISVKLQLISVSGHRIQWKCHRIQWNGHRNQKQIGRNNHLQTLFYNHFCFCQIATDGHWNQKQIGQNNHLQTLFDTLQAKPSQGCKRVWERKKDGLALSSHFSGNGQLCGLFLISEKNSMKLYPPKKLIRW